MFNRAVAVAGIVLLLHGKPFAQSVSTLIGARSNGLGYASSCLQDEWSLFNNVAGLAKSDHKTVFTSFDWKPSLPLGNRMGAGAVTPVPVGVAGLGFFRFGDDLYSEQLLTLGFANKFGLASLGGRVNYIQYNAEGFGRKGVVSISLGGIAELTPSLEIGAYITNINQPKLSVGEEEYLPTILVAGVGFNPSDKVFVTVEVEKDIDYDPIWKAGLEYKPFKKAAFRTGFNLHPNTAFFGTGFLFRKFKIDYAMQYSVVIGTGHQASLSYQL